GEEVLERGEEKALNAFGEHAAHVRAIAHCQRELAALGISDRDLVHAGVRSPAVALDLARNEHRRGGVGGGTREQGEIARVAIEQLLARRVRRLQDLARAQGRGVRAVDANGAAIAVEVRGGAGDRNLRATALDAILIPALLERVAIEGRARPIKGLEVVLLL